MIQRIEYANSTHTRTAAVVKHAGPRGWALSCGNRASSAVYVTYHRTMTEAQARARIWCREEAPQ